MGELQHSAAVVASDPANPANPAARAQVDANTLARMVRASIERWRSDAYGLKPLIGYIAAFLLTYVACLIVPYAFSDDYPDVVEAVKHGLGEGFTLRMTEGRPTIAVLYAASFTFIHSIGDLRYLRLAGVLGLALFAWVLYRALRANGIEPRRAFLLPLVICALPAFEIFVAWSIAIYAVYCVLFSALAVVVAERASRSASLRTGWLLYAAAVLLFLLGLTITQAGAMVYWFVAALYLFVPQRPLADVGRRLLRYGAVGVVGMVLALLIAEVLPPLLYGPSAMNARTSMVIPTNIPFEITWFVNGALRNSLNLVNLGSSKYVAVLVGLFVPLGLLLHFQGPWRARLLKLGLALAFIPLTYAPMFVVGNDWPSYRTQAGLSALVALYVALGVFALLDRSDLGKAWLTTGALGLAAVGSLLVAASNVTLNIAIPQYVEYAYFASQLRAVPPATLASASSIYVIRPEWFDSPAPNHAYDEFGYPSSTLLWGPPNMAYLVLRDVDPARADMSVLLSPTQGPADPPPSSIVINMRQLKDFSINP